MAMQDVVQWANNSANEELLQKSLKRRAKKATKDLIGGN